MFDTGYPLIYVFHHPRALSRVSLSSERQTAAPAELCLRVIRSKHLRLKSEAQLLPVVLNRK